MNSALLISGLADHIWQSTAMLACIGLLTLALRNHSARLRHRLWMIGSAKFLLPFSVLIALGAYLKPAAPQLPTQPALSVVLGQITEPFSAGVQITATTERAGKISTVAASRGSNQPNELAFSVAGIWACGFLTVLAAWGRKWQRIRSQLRVAEEIGSIDQVRIVSAKWLVEPGVFGILKPRILLPEGIGERLSKEQLNAVLAHELFHVRFHDNLSAGFHMFVQALFWFHPLVWWIGKRLVEERELACDEAVLQAGNEPEAYAQGILNVCKNYLESSLVCVSGVTGADLKKRVVRIVTNQVARKLDFTRKFVLCAGGIFALATPVTFGLLHVVEAHAQSAPQNSPQDLSGTWQGTLHAPGGHDLRLLLKVAKANDGWTAQVYSIDQVPQPIPVSALTLQGADVKFTVLRVGGSFEGKMSPDGSTITGTWSQGSGLPLVLKRMTPDTAWPIPEAQPRPAPMAADANPTFEVATVKPSKPDAPGKGFMVRGRRLTTLNTTLEDLLTFSYHVNARQVIGLPPWATSEKFDVEAQPDGEGQPSDSQWRAMVQKLITDRFKFTFHREQKELSVYALTVGKNGSKLTPNHDDPNGLPGLFFRGLGDLAASNADMGHLCEILQGAVLDRPVIDQTGLKGKFDFELKWTPDPTQFANLGMKMPPPSTAPDAPPDLFAAIQQQLGLKLEATKGPVTVFVVDHVQQPTAN